MRIIFLKKISLKKYSQWMRCTSLLYRSELQKSPKSNWSGRMDAVHTLQKIRCSQISTLTSRFSIWIARVYFSIVVWLVPCLHSSRVKEFEVNWSLFSNFGAFFFGFSIDQFLKWILIADVVCCNWIYLDASCLKPKIQSMVLPTSGC